MNSLPVVNSSQTFNQLFGTLEDVYERATAKLREISKETIGENVLVVGHIGLMRSLILGTLASRKVNPVDLEVRSFELPNAAIVVLDSDGETIELTAAIGLKFLR